MASSHFSEYARGIRAAVRALWLGVMDYYQAWEAIELTVRRGIPQAFYEGAAEVGVQPSEISPPERMEIQSIVTRELGYIDGLLTAVETGDKTSGGKLAPLLRRADMWANRYRDAANRAREMVGGDRKLMWVYGPTEHCVDCERLNGKVKRASQWEAAGLRPQSPALTCKGYNCLCELVPTDEPMSKGPLPRLRGA